MREEKELEYCHFVITIELVSIKHKGLLKLQRDNQTLSAFCLAKESNLGLVQTLGASTNIDYKKLRKHQFLLMDKTKPQHLGLHT